MHLDTNPSFGPTSKAVIVKVAVFFARLGSFLRRSLQSLLLRYLPGSSRTLGPPRRFRASASDDLQRSSAEYLEIHPPSQFFRTQPKTIDTRVPAVYQEASLEELPASGVFVLDNGRVCGTDPTVITADDAVLLDLSQQWAPYHSEIYTRWRLPPVQRIDGPVLVLAASPGYNYCHWFHQMLPRLALAESAGYPREDFHAFVINSGAPFIKDSLRLLGIPPESCIETSPDMHVSGSPLVVPSVPKSGNPSPWIVDFLRHSYWPTVRMENPDSPSRLYISRAKAPSRKIANEEILEPVLVEFGFTPVCLEDLPLQKQIEMFANADVVCGLHGAGLTNTFFSRPGAKLIEIVQPHFPVICYWTWASVCGLDYFFVLGEGEPADYMDWSRYKVLNHLDVLCDPAKLRATFLLAGL